jgi:hypothetical protein
VTILGGERVLRRRSYRYRRSTSRGCTTNRHVVEGADVLQVSTWSMTSPSEESSFHRRNGDDHPSMGST